MVTTNSRSKRAEACAWNKAHATIEVVLGIDRSEVARYFLEKAKDMQTTIDRAKWDYGKDSVFVKKQESIQAHYTAVANKCQ